MIPRVEPEDRLFPKTGALSASCSTAGWF